MTRRHEGDCGKSRRLNRQPGSREQRNMHNLYRVLRRLWQLPGYVINLATDRLLWPNLLRLQEVRFGRGLRLYGCPWVGRHPLAEIEIGRSVSLHSRPRSNLFYLPRPCTIHAIREGARIHIGDETAISGAVIIAETSIEIGRRVQIGPEVIIIDSDFHPADPILRARRSSEGVIRRPVKIGDDVFIGVRAIIMKGVTIGDGSLIGAGAVVFQSVKPGAIVTGSPPGIFSPGGTITEGGRSMKKHTVRSWGAGAVVTKDVAAGDIVAGNPARVVGSVKAPVTNT